MRPSRAYRLILEDVLQDRDYRAYRAVLLLAKLHRGGPKWRRILRDRVRFLGSILLFLKLLRFRRVTQPSVIVEPSVDPEVIRGRQYFVERYFANNAVPVHWRHGIPIGGWTDFQEVLRTFWIFLRVAATFDVSDVPLWPISKFLIWRLAIRLRNPEKVFIFNYDHVDVILLVGEFSHNRHNGTYYIPSNSTLSGQARYGNFRNVRLVTCTPPQIEELASFRAIGWMRFENTEVLSSGNVFGYEIDDMPRENKFDIAFYSSGEWASRGGILRCDDFAGIAQGKYAGSHYDLIAQHIIATLAGLAREYNLNFCIHLHPYERYLRDRHGLLPPFYGLIDGKNVHVGETGERRHSNIFDARIGIVTLSSCLYDRMNYGLETLVYIPDEQDRRPGMAYYRKRYVPSLEQISFSNMEQLERRILHLLKAQNAQAIPVGMSYS